MNANITKVIGFDPYWETDHNETDVSKITGIVRYLATGLEVEEEDEYFTTIRPGENFGWNVDVVEAAQAWRDAGGKIPEWVPPTAEEQRATVEPLSRRQFRRGLLKAGEIILGKPKITSADIEATIAAIPDETAREEAEIDWQDAAQFERLNPLVVTLSSALGFTPEEVDTLWQAALQI